MVYMRYKQSCMNLIMWYYLWNYFYDRVSLKHILPTLLTSSGCYLRTLPLTLIKIHLEANVINIWMAHCPHKFAIEQDSVLWLLCPVVTWHLKRWKTGRSGCDLKAPVKEFPVFGRCTGLSRGYPPAAGHAGRPFSACSSLLMCHSPDASHIIMADVLPNEALSRILGFPSCPGPQPHQPKSPGCPGYPLEDTPFPNKMPVAICALSWLSGHACILFFMHYHVTVCWLLLLRRLRRLSLLFMLYLYLYALPGCAMPHAPCPVPPWKL